MGESLTTHTTPATALAKTLSKRPEPDRQASRFDQRGIALQTIIIMVVLLAIAGTVAGVLLNRAGSETDRLESEETQRWAEIDNNRACEIAGGQPSSENSGDPTKIAAVEDAKPFKLCYPPAS